jgi:hypothetical protein
MQVTYLDVAGVRTRCYVAGRGAPLMLIHGIGSSADSWLRDGVDGMCLAALREDAGNRACQRIQVPDVMMVGVRTLIGVANMLMGQRNAEFARHDIAENGADMPDRAVLCRHRLKGPHHSDD